jgi:hypothetical protein
MNDFIHTKTEISTCDDTMAHFSNRFSQSKNIFTTRFGDYTYNAHNTLINKIDSLIRNTTRKQKPYDGRSANRCTQTCRICEQHSDTSISARSLPIFHQARNRVQQPDNQNTVSQLIAEVPQPFQYRREHKRIDQCDPCRHINHSHMFSWSELVPGHSATYRHKFAKIQHYHKPN